MRLGTATTWLPSEAVPKRRSLGVWLVGLALLLATSVGCGGESGGFCAGRAFATPCALENGDEGYCWSDRCCWVTFDADTGDIYRDCE